MKAQKKTGSNKARNSAARLMAVQAVYQMHKNDQTAESVVKEFIEHRIGPDADGDEMVTPNEEHFALVVRGVAEHAEQLSDMIGQNRTLRAQPAAVPKSDKSQVIKTRTPKVPKAHAVEDEKDVAPSAEPEAPMLPPVKSEPLLQAMFLCGAFELMVLQSIDAPVIISDYLHVARAFYDDGEVKLINGILDSIRKTVRD